VALTARERAAIIALRDRLLQQAAPALARARVTLARGLELARAAHVLLDPSATEEARAEASAFLTRDLPPHPKQPSAWRAWNTHGPGLAGALGCSVDDAVRRLLALGIEAAAAAAGEPRTVRVGTRWKTDARGRKRVVIPRDDLDLPEFLAWLAAMAYRHVVEVAGSEPRVPRGGARESEFLPVDAMSQMEAAARRGAARLAAESKREAERAATLLASGRRLTPLQERVVRMRAQGLATRDIAEALGCSPATVRTHLHHARHGRKR
jgi:DNA-binding CsgD family transcriptional regulator